MPSKVTTKFSPEELSLMGNPEFFYQKLSITEKVTGHFADLVDAMKTSVIHRRFDFPNQIESNSGKISKGENYLSLPYIILDFPRYFGGNDVFAIRTMFWWGKSFNMFLQLSGNWLRQYSEKLMINKSLLNGHNYLVSRGRDPWIHDLWDDSYQAYDEMAPENISELDYFKIGRALEIEKISRLQEFVTGTYENYLSLLGNA